MNQKQASARAPASIGNVAVGFDCMGLAFGALWDEVTAHVCPDKSAHLGSVNGLVNTLPAEIARNTALRAAQAVLDKAKTPFGVTLDITKGIPMSAGMGGSAASAVAAALAVNALLPISLSQDDLFFCALQGEAASSDPPPPDNVAAAFYGGLVLIGNGNSSKITPIPLPEGLTCLLFHPDIKVNTRDARDLLEPNVPLTTAIAQMRYVGGFVAGCFLNDHALIAQNLRDGLVEPQRAALVPPFTAARAAALNAGALGCSLSGSGPSVFSWATNAKTPAVGDAMGAAFDIVNCPITLYQEPLQFCCAAVIP